MITIRERGTRFNYFREISRVQGMYIKKKLGKNCKFARCIMRAGNVKILKWVKISLSFFCDDESREEEGEIVFEVLGMDGDLE